MKNAALRHFICRQMREQIAVAARMGAIEEALGSFSQLFGKWVATFKKDEYEDEWSLF